MRSECWGRLHHPAETILEHHLGYHGRLKQRVLKIRVHVPFHPRNLELGCRNVVRRNFRATVDAEQLRVVSVEITKKIIRMLTQGFEGVVRFLDMPMEVVVRDAAETRTRRKRKNNDVV